MPPILNGVAVVMLTLGGLIFFASSPAVKASVQSQPVSPDIVPFNKTKWEALIKYDEQIATIAEKLKPFGQKWVDEFARAYPPTCRSHKINKTGAATEN